MITKLTSLNGNTVYSIYRSCALDRVEKKVRVKSFLNTHIFDSRELFANKELIDELVEKLGIQSEPMCVIDLGGTLDNPSRLWTTNIESIDRLVAMGIAARSLELIDNKDSNKVMVKLPEMK